MKVRHFTDETALSLTAAEHAAAAIRMAIQQRGRARVLASVPAGGFLRALAAAPDVAWSVVELFDADELIGPAPEHPASARRRLFDELIGPARVGRYHLLDGKHEPERSCRAEGEALRAAAIDVAWVEIGGNGRLALHDPPADFATEKPFGIVRLDEVARRELVQAGRFAAIAEVPDRAITISIRQLMKASTILCFATTAASADAVQRCGNGVVSPLAPASILQTHRDATVYSLPADAAKELRGS